MNRRVMPILAALALLLPLAWASPSAAKDDGSVVREMVLVSLEPDGVVDRTRVLQLLRLDDDAVSVADPDDVDVRQLSGFAGPDGEDGELVWRTDGTRDSLALATGERELPLRVEVDYFLDGERTEAADLRGASGTVRIEIDLENVSGERRTVRGDAVTARSQAGSVEVFLPIEFVVSTVFPSDMWSDVRVAQAYLETNRAGDEVVLRPGLLNPPVGPERATVVIEATGEDIRLPALRIVSHQRVSAEAEDALGAQLSTVAGLFSGLDSISSSMTSIYDGTLQLADGVVQILDATGEKGADGDPVVALDATGTPTTLLGALGFLADGLTGELLPAIGRRDAATGDPIVTLDANGDPTTAIGALGFLEDNVRDALLAGIGRRDPATGEAVKAVDERGRALTLLWGLQSSVDLYRDQVIPGMDQLIAGVDELIGSLQSLDPADPGLVEAVDLLIANLDSGGQATDFASALAQIKQFTQLGIASLPPGGDPTFYTLIDQIATLLVTSLGQPGVPTDQTVIGGLELIKAGVGERDPVTGQPVVTLDAFGNPTTALAALGFIRSSALTNAAFTQPQPALGGRTPKAYRAECPACFDPAHPLFDPATADPRFLPGIREILVLTAEGFEDSIEQVETFDMGNPGLVEGLELVAGGARSLANSLHTLSPSSPGLVDGLEVVVAGVDAIVDNVQSLDDADPGLVEGLRALRGGVSALSQGVLSLRELGVRTAKAQIGEAGDDLALRLATMAQQREDLVDYTVLAAGADEGATTFIFEIAAQETAARDNAVRGGLIGLSGLALLGLARRRIAVL